MSRRARSRQINSCEKILFSLSLQHCEASRRRWTVAPQSQPRHNTFRLIYIWRSANWIRFSRSDFAYSWGFGARKRSQKSYVTVEELWTRFFFDILSRINYQGIKISARKPVCAENIASTSLRTQHCICFAAFILHPWDIQRAFMSWCEWEGTTIDVKMSSAVSNA